MTSDLRHGAHRPITARLVFAGALLTLIALLVGCSGSSDDAAPSPTTATSASTSGSSAPSTSSTSSTVSSSGGSSGATGSSGAATSSNPPVNPTTSAPTAPDPEHTTKAPVKIDATATFSGKVTAKISKVAPITATAQGPGEISGPAVAITIAITNGSANSISLGSSVVNLYYGAQVPGLPMSGAPNSPFKGVLAAGKTSSAVYVFTIPVADRGKVTLEISYSPSAPVVQFTGSAA